MTRKLVPYRRVSTKRQGESGLGLEAQDQAIQQYSQATAGVIIGQYTEVETGKRDELRNRPELIKAIGHAKRSRAVLVIAKLDRLTRSVYVMAELHRSGVEFVCCDNPHANRMTIQILAVMAEQESQAISQRTRAALAVYKATRRVSKRLRGLYPAGVPQAIVDATAGLLGSHLPNAKPFTDETRRRAVMRAASVNRAMADQAYDDIAPTVQEWRDSGLTLQAIADRLNEQGQSTRREKQWTRTQVLRILRRVARQTS